MFCCQTHPPSSTQEGNELFATRHQTVSPASALADKDKHGELCLVLSHLYTFAIVPGITEVTLNPEIPRPAYTNPLYTNTLEKLFFVQCSRAQDEEGTSLHLQNQTGMTTCIHGHSWDKGRPPRQQRLHQHHRHHHPPLHHPHHIQYVWVQSHDQQA